MHGAWGYDDADADADADDRQGRYLVRAGSSRVTSVEPWTRARRCRLSAADGLCSPGTRNPQNRARGSGRASAIRHQSSVSSVSGDGHRMACASGVLGQCTCAGRRHVPAGPDGTVRRARARPASGTGMAAERTGSCLRHGLLGAREPRSFVFEMCISSMRVAADHLKHGRIFALLTVSARTPLPHLTPPKHHRPPAATLGNQRAVHAHSRDLEHVGLGFCLRLLWVFSRRQGGFLRSGAGRGRRAGGGQDPPRVWRRTEGNVRSILNSVSRAIGHAVSPADCC